MRPRFADPTDTVQWSCDTGFYPSTSEPQAATCGRVSDNACVTIGDEGRFCRVPGDGGCFDERSAPATSHRVLPRSPRRRGPDVLRVPVSSTWRPLQHDAGTHVVVGSHGSQLRSVSDCLRKRCELHWILLHAGQFALLNHSFPPNKDSWVGSGGADTPRPPKDDRVVRIVVGYRLGLACNLWRDCWRRIMPGTRKLRPEESRGLGRCLGP